MLLTCTTGRAETLAYGTRAGMDVTVVKKSSIGTTHAKILTRHTRRTGYAEDCKSSHPRFESGARPPSDREVQAEARERLSGIGRKTAGLRLGVVVPSSISIRLRPAVFAR